ncbi:MAG TPA: adenylosuccinate synthase [Patescibacteria group bacterium]|nr:adenylosuccinate synthase [Patescibacteria group bacterium]
MAKKTLQSWQGTLAVIGVDWGDSGKGRLTDDLSARADVIARFNGGANTGHTVENQYGKFALHIIPSGIFNQKAKCLVGRNVVVDLESLVLEMSALAKAGVSYKNLLIDEQASLVMPWHKMRDGLREKLRSAKIGTTGRGVGPAYADRTERVGLLVKDLVSSGFAGKIEEEVKIQNKFYSLNLNANEIVKQYQKYQRKVKNFIGKSVPIISHAQKAKKNILFEGAQGYFLDIDAGTYPYVTSSNPGVVGIARSFDIHTSEINEVIGITKAYTTRVGEGPMPTKITGEVGRKIVDVGREVGTTTGRERAVGWLDSVLIKEAARANKLTALAVTKLDVLTNISKLKLCISYDLNGKSMDYIGHDAEFLSKVRPVYEDVGGWAEDISSIRSFTDLPKNAQNYIRVIEKITKVPVKFISVGPKRGEVIYL